MDGLKGRPGWRGRGEPSCTEGRGEGQARLSHTPIIQCLPLNQLLIVATFNQQDADLGFSHGHL